MDGNQNYLYDFKIEMIVFCDFIIIFFMEVVVCQDMLWKDIVIIDMIKIVGYICFLLDNIVLRVFKGINNCQYLFKSECDKENYFILFFSVLVDMLFVLKGLNFDEKDVFIIEMIL